MRLLDSYCEESLIKPLFNRLKTANKNVVETKNIEKLFNIFKKEGNNSVRNCKKLNFIDFDFYLKQFSDLLRLILSNYSNIQNVFRYQVFR